MTDIIEVLRGITYFADLPGTLLEAVCSQSEEIVVDAGTRIIEEDSMSTDMYVLAEGEIQVTKRGIDRDVVLATRGPGMVVGEMAVLDSAPRTASVTATTPATLIRIPAQAFEALLEDPRVTRRMFRMVISRLREIEETFRHEERMAALGKMAAQLMHELNNPAAAVGRSAARASEVYDSLGSVGLELSALKIDLTSRLPELTPADLGPLERSEVEEELAGLLEGRGVVEAWDTAPSLVAEGWDASLLSEMLEGLDEEESRVFARWLGLRSLAGQILGELRLAANRVSELVRVVKGYSFLDQAPVQELDVREGIRDTLILLGPKLRGIEVVVDFSDDLATIEAPGRDINQVWTNLIDNAADALDGEGTLRITARNQDGQVIVEVADSGSGIDPDTVDRIFDPFFTTKEPGKGTGLGLHTVHTIVTRFGGDITVASGPEGTTFLVEFPALASSSLAG